MGTRWLGVGLASVLAVVTLGLAITGRLGLYINPDSSWFAVSMAVVVLIGAALSFLLPLGAEADHGHEHGHDHGGGSSAHGHESVGVTEPAAAASRGRRIARESEDSAPILRRSTYSPTPVGADAAAPGAAPHAAVTSAPAPELRRSARTSQDAAQNVRIPRDPASLEAHAHAHAHTDGGTHTPAHPVALAATVAGGVAASGIVLLTLLLPPASLSAELAMARDVGAPPLFAGADAVTLAATGDTSSFGVGEWAAVFATATNPEAFDGDAVTLTGFVTPSEGGAFDLTRLVITHCVIDAQPASIPVAASGAALETGQWVTISGTVSSTADGRLEIDATSVEPIAEPEDPYEY
jgi:uncharacterized repeat protein (TIGR03943 family)